MSEIKITKVTFSFDTGDGAISKSLEEPVDDYQKLKGKKNDETREKKVTLLTNMLRIITNKLNAFIPVIKQGYSKKYDSSLAKYNEQIGKYEEIMELKEKISKEDSKSESEKLEKEFEQMAKDFISAMSEIKTARSNLVNEMKKKLSSIKITGDAKQKGKNLRAGIREFIYSALDTQKSEVYKLLSPVIKKKEDKKDE